MKIYKANEELTEILFSHGLKDTTSQRDEIKGKKAFKLSKQSRKEIFFDYINIQINSSGFQLDSRIHLTEEELKLLLLYFKLSTNDFKELDTEGNFNFKEVKNRLDYIIKDLDSLTKYDIQQPRRNKLQRIIDTYTNILISKN